MDVRPDEHAEDKAELHMFRCMVVSGALRGKLPENFLMVFNNLPHEIMLKIWSFLTLNERRRLRLVCKKWKSLWETSANRKLDLVSMKISSCDGEDNKIEIKCWSLARHHYLHQLVTTVSESSLDQLLSLVQLKSANGVDAGLKISVEGKVLPIVLTSVMKQGWTVSGLFLVGDMRQVTEDQFCSFIEAINVGNVLKKFQLMEASINSGFLTDRLISVLGTALVQFIVDISRSASNGVNLCSISNKSLTNLVKSGMTTVLPATPNISSEAVAAALVLTMEASADADTFITCPTEVYIEKSSNLDFLLIRDYLASKSRSKRHQGSDMKLWTVQNLTSEFDKEKIEKIKLRDVPNDWQCSKECSFFLVPSSRMQKIYEIFEDTEQWAEHTQSAYSDEWPSPLYHDYVDDEVDFDDFYDEVDDIDNDGFYDGSNY